MTVTRRRVGTGATRRDVLVLDGASPENIRDTLRHAVSKASFEGWIEDVERRAREIAAATEPSSLTLSQSQADYAASIIWHINMVRHAIAAGQAADAAHFAVELGYLVREASLKQNADLGLALRTRNRAANEISVTRRKQEIELRNKRLARDFIARWETDQLYPPDDRDWQSPTELKVKIGHFHGLGRSQAIRAINDGLKLLGR